MKLRFSYLITGLFLFFTTNIYAQGVSCTLATSGIPAQTSVCKSYENIYNCHNAGFIMKTLSGSSVGSSDGVSVGGDCQGRSLGGSQSCQFKLNFRPTKNGTDVFHLQVVAGSTVIDLPDVTTTVGGSPSQAKITWPAGGLGSATVDADGNGTGYFSPAKDSSGHTVTYTYKLSGAGSVTDITPSGDKVTFKLTGAKDKNETVTFTASADDAPSKDRAPIKITGSTPPPKAEITWPAGGLGYASVDTDGAGSGYFSPATDSSGHAVTYTYKLSGAGSVTDITPSGDRVTFNLTGAKDKNETVTFTASADDAPSKDRDPIVITQQHSTHEIKWPNSDEGTASVDNKW